MLQMDDKVQKIQLQTSSFTLQLILFQRGIEICTPLFTEAKVAEWFWHSWLVFHTVGVPGLTLAGPTLSAVTCLLFRWEYQTECLFPPSETIWLNAQIIIISPAVWVLGLNLAGIKLSAVLCLPFRWEYQTECLFPPSVTIWLNAQIIIIF